ncbi:MAG: hypothetical protein ACP5HM_06900 [Anaerolineae bacterium]
MERDRLSILLAVVLTGATLLRFVELPTFSWSVRRILGSPLGFTLDGNWLLPLLVMGVVGTGTYALLQTLPRREGQERPLFFSLITPVLGALFVSLLLLKAPSWSIWLGTLLLSGLLIGLLVHLTYHVFYLDHPSYPGLRTLLNLVDYVLGFALFGIVLSAQGRSLITAPVILALSGLLSLDLLSASGAPPPVVLTYGGLIALLEAELSWVLSYWPLSPWGAAMVLTLGLYVESGLAYQHLTGTLNRRIVVEFMILTALVFALVLVINP